MMGVIHALVTEDSMLRSYDTFCVPRMEPMSVRATTARAHGNEIPNACHSGFTVKPGLLA